MTELDNDKEQLYSTRLDIFRYLMKEYRDLIHNMQKDLEDEYTYTTTYYENTLHAATPTPAKEYF